LYEERLGNKGGVGESDPIHINSKWMPQILYLPDGHYKTSHGKVRIYEVLDYEMKDPNLIIADIIQAYLTQNVSLIQFIVPTPRDQDIVKELAVTIYDRLVQMGVSRRSLRQVRTMFISKDEANTRVSVAEKLAIPPRKS